MLILFQYYFIYIHNYIYITNRITNTLVLYFNFSYYWETYSGGTNGTELGHIIFEIKNGHICVKQPFTYSN